MGSKGVDDNFKELELPVVPEVPVVRVPVIAGTSRLYETY